MSMYDIAIVGGGIVGLSTAYNFLRAYPNKKVIIVEKESEIGLHQSGHNSGVIHSGLYYKPGSLKAINCRNGIVLLKEFCDKYNLKYEICGKLVIATNQTQIESLKILYKRGIQNGIKDLHYVKKEEISDYEPYAVGEAALYYGETGIIDYSVVCNQLKDLIEINGEIKTGFNVDEIIDYGSDIEIRSEFEEVRTKFLINCAGLFSDKISKICGFKRTCRIIPFRGEYFMISKKANHLVKNLIYPVPDPRYPFLGVHLTRTIDNHLEVGPNAVLAFAREGYKKSDVNLLEMWDYLSYPGFWKMSLKYWETGFQEYYRSFFKKFFLKSLNKLVPDFKIEDLKYCPSGIRAQALNSLGNLIDDFVIDKRENMLHVINAPSPAATSSLSIAEHLVSYYDSIIS